MSTTPKRFVIEGTWSGYRSSQQRVVHRQVYPGVRKKLRAWAGTFKSIIYTDGTRLDLFTRDCKPREKVQEIRGYSSLIEDCAFYNVTSVQALQDAKASFKAAHTGSITA